MKFRRIIGWRPGTMLAIIPVMAGTLLMQSAGPAEASSPPVVTDSWYLYGTTASSLNTDAYNNAYAFAGEIPSGDTKWLILDFGAGVSTGGRGYGAVDFSNTAFTNGQILTALKKAADGEHDGYRTGSAVISYGNSNYHEGLSYSDEVHVGTYQEQRAGELASYQRARGYRDQGAAAASDMEPSWESYGATKGLVDGAARGPYPYLDYGSADGCPTSGSGGGSCNNGWNVSDVGYISFHGKAFSFPEIYNITANSQQWSVIRKSYGGSYKFLGVTGQPPKSTARAGWSALDSRNSGLVGRELNCFGC